jgi:hypothetical protein
MSIHGSRKAAAQAATASTPSPNAMKKVAEA